MRNRVALAAAVIGVCGGLARADLDGDFRQPPDSAKPRTWWHWISGNVSAEGITADLDAMKAIGLGGAQLFTVDQSDVKGPVKFMSPQWRGFVHQAMAEANRLGLEMSVEGCDGWSESGGPWVEPAQAMQHLVWTEATVAGGQHVKLDLPQPTATRGYYQDVATLAFPTPRGDDLPRPALVAVNTDKVVDANAMIDGRPDTSATITRGRDDLLQITVGYAKPVTCSSVTLAGDSGLSRYTGQLEASSDGGKSYHRVGSASLVGTSAFEATTADTFRLTFTDVRSTQVSLSEVSVGGPRIDRLRERSAAARMKVSPAFTDAAALTDDAIDPAKIVDLSGKAEWDAPAGQWTVIRFGHTCTGTVTHPSTTAGLECDKLSRAAVESHLEHMYGPLLADSPAEVGKSLRYILLDSWEAGVGNWTPAMRDEFKKRRGYDMTAWLPAMTGRIVRNTDDAERFLWDLRRTVSDLLTENHYGTVQQYAHAHGLGVYAEAPGVDTPTVADALACKGRTDIPMGEFWVNWSADQDIDDPKEAASAAHIYGKPIVATESFTSTPETAAWTNDPYSLKRLGDMEFCLGVNRFVFHRYAHQPWNDRVPGMSMGPWGINFERTNTWWTPGAAWIAYLSRCQAMLQRGRFVADLLYYTGDNTPAGFAHKLLNPAPPAGFDYDACNAEVLLGQSKVEQGEVVLNSGMRYRVLVLPDTDRMTLPVLKQVQTLVRDGATVVGRRPQHSPSLSDTDAAIQQVAGEVWGDCDGDRVTEHAYGKGKVQWGGTLLAGVTPDFAASQPGVMSIHRKDGDADLYFVSNQQTMARTVACTFRVTGKVPELWHADTGAVEPVALYRSDAGTTTVPIPFDPSGSAFVVFRSPAKTPDAVTTVRRDGDALFTDQSYGPADLPVATDQGWSLTVRKPGTYTVQTAAGATASTTVAPLLAPIKVAGPWAVTFPPKRGAPASAAFDHLMSWTDSTEEGIRYFSGTATYGVDVTVPAEYLGENRGVRLDLGDVKNLAEVTVNGQPLGVLWKEPFQVDIGKVAKPGVNHIEVRVTNLWPNRLIGDQKLPAAQRVTWASVSQYKADAKLLPSGLLGPVRLVPSQTVIVPRP